MAQQKDERKLTKRIIEESKPKKQRYHICDTGVPGLKLRILPSGHKSFVVPYREKDSGRQRCYTICNAIVIPLDQARDEALEVLRQVSKGESPVEDRQQNREIPLFKDFVEEYFEKYAAHEKKPSSITSDRLLVKHLLPKLGNKRVNSITHQDMKNLHEQISRYSPLSKKPSPIAANRVLRLMRKMMNLCEDWQYRDKHTNPCDGIKQNQENTRDRVLDPHKEVDAITGEEIGPGELERFLKACSDSLKDGSEHPRMIFMFLTIMATGARRGEIMNLRKSELFLHKGHILKEDHKGRRKHQKKPKRIELNSLAILLLHHTLTHFCREDCEWVFESHKRPGNPYNNVHKPKTRLIERAGIENFRIHDMRHTFSTLLSEKSDVSLKILKNLLGHDNSKTTEGYIHQLAQPGEAKSEGMSEIMRQYLDLPLEDDKVVSIASARKR